VEAGKTVTLGCPGVTEDSLVLMLEWRANGMRLLEYKSSSTTVVRHFRDRMSLSLKNYSLHLHPVTAADSGTYECVVNNRNALDAVIKLIVRGECVSFLFSGFAPKRFVRASSISRRRQSPRGLRTPGPMSGESRIRGCCSTINIAASRFLQSRVTLGDILMEF